MKSLYNSLGVQDIIILITVPIILMVVLITLNKIFSKLIKLKSLQSIRSTNRGRETYEFGTNSIGSVKSISNNQFIILAILFLIFDIELIFLLPWILNIKFLWSVSNLTLLLFSHIIIYSLIIELKENILVWYKPKKKLEL